LHEFPTLGADIAMTPNLLRLFAAICCLGISLAVRTGCLAAEIREGDTLEVKANSIWFQDAAQLTRWQQLKKSGDRKALAAYEKDVLRTRDAWQFINQLTVKVLGYKPADNQVNVEMKTEGRMLGTTWFLDPATLVPSPR
jgi:hypothetical protein